MDYATALEVFFQPAPDGTPAPAPVENAAPPRPLLQVDQVQHRRTGIEIAGAQPQDLVTRPPDCHSASSSSRWVVDAAALMIARACSRVT